MAVLTEALERALPLVHLAVLCAENAYKEEPFGTTVDTDVRRIITSSHTQSNGCILVVAISGTQSLKDWKVNCRNLPYAPHIVLNDSNNLCHAGFLKVTRRLLDPLATALKDANGSTLLFTGHSAGGAIASLLYAHIASVQDSSLSRVAGRFPHIHCIVFGCPPTSTLPLPRFPATHFLSFLNEGDPIVKADRSFLARKHPWLYRRSDSKGALEDGLDGAAQSARRLFINSGTLVLIKRHKAQSGSRNNLSVQHVNNESLERTSSLLWGVHGIAVYRKRIGRLVPQTTPSERKTDKSSLWASFLTTFYI